MASDPPAASYRTPNLIRSYRAGMSAAVSPSQGPNPSVCSGAVSGDADGSIRTSTGWCLSATVTRTARGHDLALVVCRDSRGASQLHYARRQEVDLTVLSAGRPVWRWSADHADAPEQHVLDTGAESCWTWTARWTDVDGSGRTLPAGDYALAAATSADELRVYDDAQAAFQVD